MDQSLLLIHSILRWVILFLLLVVILQAIAKKPAIRGSSLILLISAHTMFLIGIYQLINGRFGIRQGMIGGGSLMKNAFYRFYWVEHPLLMLIAIILITVARGKAKMLNYKATSWLLIIALILILAAVPWPFREIVGRPWYRTN